MSSTLALLALASLAAAPGAAPDRLVVLSLDGLHPGAVTPRAMPALHAAGRAGRLLLEGRSTRPPKTLIAHTAMLTGLPPEASGKEDNDWRPGEPTVEWPTLLDDAKGAGFRTAFFYGKEKLGFLVTPGVDEHALSPGDGLRRARAFLARPGRAAVVLHVSGLEAAGMKDGWMSPAYLAAAAALDRALEPLLEELERGGRYLLVVTSDHAGHGREHGTDDPEDALRPVVFAADRGARRRLPEPPRAIEELRRTVAGLLRR